MERSGRDSYGTCEQSTRHIVLSFRFGKRDRGRRSMCVEQERPIPVRAERQGHGRRRFGRIADMRWRNGGLLLRRHAGGCLPDKSEFKDTDSRAPRLSRTPRNVPIANSKRACRPEEVFLAAAQPSPGSFFQSFSMHTHKWNLTRDKCTPTRSANKQISRRT